MAVSMAIAGAAGLPATPAEGYRFASWRGEVLSAAEAIRWEADALPLRFRALANANLPEVVGFDEAAWSDLIRRSISTWVAVPTSTIELVLESEPVAADRADAEDGMNTIGFSSDEFFVDSSFWGGFVSRRYDGGRLSGCDVEINPFWFGEDPVADPEVAGPYLLALEQLVLHELGHCIGLAHTATNPLWLLGSAPPHREPGLFPEGVETFQAHPSMSYGSSYRTTTLTPDDMHGASLLYPAPGFLRARGSLGGRVVFPDGEPAPHVFLGAVDYSGGSPVFGPGVFSDAGGRFLLEAMPPGPLHLWVRPLMLFRAHGDLVEAASAAGSLDALDTQRWFRVRAGEITLVPDIVVRRGRASGG